MPETGKLLSFPVRSCPTLSSAQMAEEALRYVELGLMDAKALCEPDVLLNVCKLLRDAIERTPTNTLDRGSNLYERVAESTDEVGLFDERDYVLGELALISSKSSRLLGRLKEAERWLDRSDAAFRHTVDSAPALASVAFERLAVRYSGGRSDEVLDLVSSVSRSFERLGLRVDFAKCRYLNAMALKETGRSEESISVLRELAESETVRALPSLYGQVLVQIGEYQSSVEDYAGAAQTYEKALPIVMAGRRPVALGELKWAIGDAYRGQGALDRALRAYRSANADYQELGLEAFSVKLHLVIADVLLALNHPREAEWEILAALPKINEEGMVPEGLAAVSLLKESVARRQTDRAALGLVREHIRLKS